MLDFKKHYVLYFLILIATLLYIYLGITHYSLNADVSRDLSFLSDLWIYKMVWLGPQLRIGFPASPIYFYMFLPALLLTGGSAYSTVITQAIIAGAGLFFYAYFLKNKKYSILLSILFIGSSDWWINNTVYPWNGHVYIHWLMLALIFLWHKKSLWLSILLFGIAAAIHPATLMVTPIFLYELWKSKKYKIIQKPFIFIFGLLLPWTPILTFEFLTKGFLVRQWMLHKNTGMTLDYGFENIISTISLSGINFYILFIILILSLLLGSKRSNAWYLLLIPTLVFLVLISPLHQYYLLPVLAVLFFLMSKTLIKNNLGKIILLTLVIIFSQNAYRQYTKINNWPPQNRLENINAVVRSLESNNLINFDAKYALISVIDDMNSTPQADDYRFVFRTKGLKADNITEYPNSDYLIIFFEKNQVDPNNWMDWHTDHFGNKEIMYSDVINSVQVVIYKRI